LIRHTILELFSYVLAEQQQGYEQQGQQGNGFVQNVQYQTIPQYGQ